MAIDTLTGPAFAGLLHAVLDRRFVLSRNSSCYTYYEPGDYLSPHRDNADDCEATVLVYLDAVSPDPDAVDSGLYLRIHDDDAGRPGAVCCSIRTRNNRVVVGRGSQVWHARPTLRDGERLSLLSACFSAAED